MERVKAARGTSLRCRSWRQEAILRMLENNLENAEKPEELIIYGGAGEAARGRGAVPRGLLGPPPPRGGEEHLIPNGHARAPLPPPPHPPRRLLPVARLLAHRACFA